MENEIKYIPTYLGEVLFYACVIASSLGVLFIVSDLMGFGQAHQLGALTGGILLQGLAVLGYVLYLKNHVTVSFTNTVSWHIGRKPFKFSRIFRYSEIKEMHVTALSGLQIKLIDNSRYSLTSSSMRVTGELQDRDDPNLPHGPAKEFYLLRDEIEKRISRNTK